MSGILVKENHDGEIHLDVNIGQAPLPPEEFTDWSLPSIDELDLIYDELYTQDVGNIAADSYWSSTETGNNSANNFSFGAGAINNALKTALLRVRAFRTFSAPTGSYSVRDTGPSGGWIFLVETGNPNDLCYEVAPLDQSTSYAWSNVTDQYIGTTLPDVGEGHNNTAEIINQVGHTNSAAKLCDDLII